MNRKGRNRWIALSAGTLLTAAASASGQVPGWNVEFIFAPGQTEIRPETPSCMVRLWARFSSQDYGFMGARLDFSAGDGVWVQHRLNPRLACCNATPGVIVGPSVMGIASGQLHFPPANIFADPSNPIMVWEATWTATNFTGRPVPFRTRTHRFDCFCGPRQSCVTTSRMTGLTEGAAELPVAGPCVADCDTSTGVWTLDVFDFLCFQNQYDEGKPAACDCDTTTGPGVCDVFDFVCFQNAFAAGCP